MLHVHRGQKVTHIKGDNLIRQILYRIFALEEGVEDLQIQN